MGMSTLLCDDRIKALVFGERKFRINKQMLELRETSQEPYCNGLLLELIADCNCRCPLCPAPPWQTKRFRTSMSLEVAKRVVDESKKYVPRYNVNYANEPLLSPHVISIVNYIHEAERLSWLYTNCDLLTKDKSEALINAHLDFIRLAIDGLDAESHEFYRRGTNFDRVFRNVMDLIEMKSKLGTAHPYIQIFTLKHRLNHHKEKEYRAFWEKYLGINGVNEFLMFLPNMNLIKRKDGKGAADLLKFFPEDLDETRYAYNDCAKLSARNVIPKCYSPVYPAVVSDGNVIICCQDPFGNHILGNIYDDSFEKIWLSQRGLEMRGKAERMEFEMCKQCNLRGM